MNDIVLCPACNAKLRPGRLRCPRCGERLSPTAATPEWPGPPAERHGWRPAAALAAVAVIGLLWLGLRESSRPVPVEPGGAASGAPAAAPVPAASPPELPDTTPAERVAVPPFADPEDAAHVAYANEDFETALRHYQDALDRNPEDAESHSNLGQVLVRLGRVADALPHFERAIALDPKRWAYHFNLARAHGELGDWDRAVAGYEAAAGLFPDDYVTEYNLARARHKAGDEPGAVDGYKRAIALAPEEPTFHLSLGISLERLDRRPEAAAAYARYLELAPEAGNAEAVRARIAQLTGAGAADAEPAATNTPG